MGFVCFTETDRIQHYSLNLPDWEEYVAPLYEEISDFIQYVQKRIAKNNEDAMVMMVSDHGAQSISHKFLSNSWMVHNNYAVLKGDVYGRGASKPQQKGDSLEDERQDNRHGGREQYTQGDIREAAETAQEGGREACRRLVRLRDPGQVHPNNRIRLRHAKTRAFCSISTGIVGMVLINDSRFASPCVSKGQTPALRKKLMKEIAMIKDLGGRRLVKEVYDWQQIFS